LEALVDIGSDSRELKDALVKLLQNQVTSQQLKNQITSEQVSRAFGFFGFLLDAVDLLAKGQLLLGLAGPTYTAPRSSWHHLDAIDAAGSLVATLSSVSPETLSTLPLPQTQTLTIIGTGFNSQTRLVFKWGNETYTSRPERLRFL